MLLSFSYYKKVTPVIIQQCPSKPCDTMEAIDCAIFIFIDYKLECYMCNGIKTNGRALSYALKAGANTWMGCILLWQEQLNQDQ